MRIITLRAGKPVIFLAIFVRSTLAKRSNQRTHWVRWGINNESAYSNFANQCSQLYATKYLSIQHEQSVDLLREGIMIRDTAYTLPAFYTVADIHCRLLFYIGL